MAVQRTAAILCLMKKLSKPKSLSASAELRRRAEERLQANTAEFHPPRTDEEMRKLVHELEVYQLELEMQNTELRRAREELELSLNTYAELYDFAPVGYFTFDPHGLIREVNLTGAQLLGIESQLLINRPFSGFISEEDGRKIFSNHLTLVLQRQVMLRCEIRLTRNDGTVIHCQLQSVAVTIENKADYILTSIIDGTVRKQLEEALQNAHGKLDLTVHERTGELTRSNVQLTQEIRERKKAEESLREALNEVKQLKNQLREENLYLREEINLIHSHTDIVGNSEAIRTVLKQIEQVAPTESTVLIQGETGTGKELLAHAIHNLSARKGRLMIKVNCAALPPTLIESELFGREKGAYTGALSKQLGRFELADASTIFLDEIDALPLELQAKLLRVLESGEFERLGSPRTVKVDVRIISATNRDLGKLSSEGGFREDIYYRLNVFKITIPPLRERREDILPLVWSFVQEFSKRMGKRIESIPQKGVEALQAYPWPGNVRELRNITERAMIITTGPVLQLDIPKTAQSGTDQFGTLEEVEKRHIIEALNTTGWRVSGKDGAAEILDINPKTLESRMQRLGIQRIKKNA
jgi:formate hydrogenlyase transcriptional activator